MLRKSAPDEYPYHRGLRKRPQKSLSQVEKIFVKIDILGQAKNLSDFEV